MRYRILWVASLLLVAVLFAANWGSRAQVPARKSWEYKVVVTQYGAQPASMSEQDLNKLGAEGWELVETRVVESTRARDREYRTDYFFKRVR
ncbi:MAG TPA: DUF4177 domain-containing protein [Pyrinomonadaceae bacterium]|nr:DUF4177 domain-containing protein [Pyrinomonadaceae bacterium]